MFKESRLIGVKLSTIQNQRVQAGLTPTTSAANPTGYQTPAQANAAGTANQVQTEANIRANAANAGTYVGQADPSLTAQQLKSQEDLNNYYAGNNPDGTSNANPNDPNSRGSANAPIQDHSVAPGYNPITQGNIFYDQTTGAPKTLDAILAGIDKSAANMNAQGNNVSSQDIAQQKQTAIAKYQAEQQDLYHQQQLQQQKVTAANTAQTGAANGTGTTNAAGGSAGGASGGNQPPPNPQLQTILSQLPPEASFLAPAIQAAFDTATKEQANAQTQLDQRTGSINSTLNDANTILQNQMDRAKSTLGTIQTNLSDSLDSQNKLIAQTEQNALAKLQWTHMSDVRQATADLQANMNTMRAQIALGGAIGSSNANAKMDSVRQQAEQHIQDLNAQFGFDYADTVAKFTQQTVQAHQQYTTDWLKAVDDYEGRVSAIELGFVNNDQKKADMLDKASSDFYAATDKAMEDQAATIGKAGDTVYKVLSDAQAHQDALDAAQQARQDKLQQQQDLQQYRLQSLAAQAQAHQDSLAQQGLARDAADVKTAYDQGQQAVKEIQGILQKDPAISNYTDFNTLYNRWEGVTQKGTLGTIDQSTSVLMQDLFANANNPKLTARMPAQTVELIHSNLGTWQSLIGKIMQQGGNGTLPKGVLQDMNTAMDAIHTATQEAAQDSVSTALVNAIHKNQNLNPAYRNYGIDTTDITAVVDPSIVDGAFQALANAKGISDTQKQQLLNENLGNEATGSDTSTNSDSSYFSSDITPRTDRNNNPTAMTTDVAKQAGLVEGKDYTVGDAFPNNPNLHTAKIIGDPIATTIKAIDKVGFTTSDGKPRWTYTDALGLNNATWAKMSAKQKADAVQKMYQQEGGNGSLFASTNSNS